jgi:hypothetical protein
LSPDSVTAPDNILVEWKLKVLERYGNKCANCERTRQIACCMIIPAEAGGRIKPENGVVLCRECRIAAEGARTLPLRIDNKTPINFLMSKTLYTKIDNFVHISSSFGSISALVRRMISSYIIDNEMYSDLELYQDASDEESVKINGWTNGLQYEVFRNLCQERNMTYTDTLKALLMIAMETNVIP